jgi:septum formation protein
MPRIILASGSPYRKRLLQRLDLAFECLSPGVDETPLPGEGPEALVRRLSEAKARSLAKRCPDALIIGSDQAGALDGSLLGKPGTVGAACDQLRAMSGREAEFLTGLCVLDAASGQTLSSVERCTVQFRELSDAAIQGYVRRENPIDCAGSFKVEGLGIALFRSVRLEDPTALEGLPLIRLVHFLERFGVDVLAR